MIKLGVNLLALALAGGVIYMLVKGKTTLGTPTIGAQAATFPNVADRLKSLTDGIAYSGPIDHSYNLDPYMAPGGL